MKPPFRADQVGSLLRPKELAEARKLSRQGKLEAARLKEVEDRCVRAAVARQEAIGLQAVTDGELRRDYWHLDFTRRPIVVPAANRRPREGGDPFF